MKKVIVTGASSFIGQALLKELSQRGIDVIAVVRNEKSDVKSIESLPGVRVVHCELKDIVQLQKVILDRDVDACIHLAWEGSSGSARADYALQLNNVKYALDLVNVLAKMGVKRFIGAGALAEKDVLAYHPTDGATPNAVSFYGIAKMASHFMTKAECTKLRMEHIWCLISNTYGPGNTTNNFVNMASGKMIRGERAAFTSGEQNYDFVYITDTVRALYAAAEHGRTNTSYYLGSGKPRQLKEFIKIIRDTVDPSIELHLGEIPFNGISLPDEAYDTSKLIRDMDFKNEVDFEDGIRMTIPWLRERAKEKV